MLKSFRDMHVWQMSIELSSVVFKITKSLPRAEDYGLTSQLRRSANSISANIAEGFGRNTSKDKNQFYTISRGSTFETQSHLLYGQKVGYFEIEKIEKLTLDYDELIHELNKIIKSLEA